MTPSLKQEGERHYTHITHTDSSHFRHLFNPTSISYVPCPENHHENEYQRPPSRSSPIPPSEQETWRPHWHLLGQRPRPDSWSRPPGERQRQTTIRPGAKRCVALSGRVEPLVEPLRPWPNDPCSASRWSTKQKHKVPFARLGPPSWKRRVKLTKITRIIQ